ncbi:hypothetical protein BC828DRAFT_398077 [Blastocladiella britannica]|nr:hypothetical protein BC828DRAFT_398077 [Blastocladiella britannica]
MASTPAAANTTTPSDGEGGRGAVAPRAAVKKVPEPQIIRLFDMTGSKVIDSVATDYEDSFCLDSFGELVLQHNGLDCPPPKNLPEGSIPPPPKRRAFILARVQTWDVKHPEKAYYSYYNAFHLNKILFQTQVYLGKKLIHRIHVLNPLSNTDIIGNVLYFMVRPRTDGKDGLLPMVDPASNPANISKSVSLAPLPSAPADTTITPSALERGRTSSARTSRPPSAPSANTRTRTVSSGIARIVTRRSSQQSNPRSPMLSPGGSVYNIIDPAMPQTWTLTTQLVTEYREEGDTPPSSAYPTDPSQPSRNGGGVLGNAARRMSSLGQRMVGAGPATAPATSRTADQMFAESQAARASSTARNAPPMATLLPAPVSASGAAAASSAPSPGGTRRASVMLQTQVQNVAVTSKTPDGPLLLNAHKGTDAATKVAVPAGTLTRFGAPVGAEEVAASTPVTPPRRRRALSLANQQATLTAGAPGGGAAGSIPEGAVEKAFGEWAATVTAVSPRAAAIPEEAESEDHANAPDRSVLAVPPASTAAVPAAPEEVITYDMVLFATDNDFLEQSKIRSVFRENAAAPEEAVLFEMPEYKGEQAAADQDPLMSPQSPIVVFIDDDALCDACYPKPDRIATMSPAMQTFHHCKCYFLVLLFAFGSFLATFSVVLLV